MRQVIFTALFSLIAMRALAWGPTGHRATGHVADQYLSKKARKEIQRILNGQSLAMATTWMDEIRSDSTYDYASDWHWVTIQDGETYEQSKKNPNGDLIQTIERLVAELKSKKLTAKQETESLKMLLHLIGDAHQPLHIGGGDDRGGNDVKVKWFREDSNLHRVWDSDMIDDTHLSFTELAQSLDKVPAEQLSVLQRAPVREWAVECMKLRPAVYNIGDGKLGYRYAYLNFHIVRRQLLYAGIRMAGILNEIYK